MGDSIQRFSPYAIDGGADAYGAMEEDASGDYVNFEDHRAALDAAQADRAAAVEAFRAGMRQAADICKMTGVKIEGHTKDHPVNWAHNCGVFIGMNAAEMTDDDIAAALRALAEKTP